MSVRIAIIAALPREIRGLVGRAAPDRELKRRGIYLFRMDKAVVVAAGMGASRVTLGLEAAISEGGIELVVSTGLAGACAANLPAGAVAEAGIVVDALTGERFRTANEKASAILVTTDTIAGVQEKARLVSSYGAAMVDMEAATLARLALAHGLAFRAIKGISDPHDFELASLSRFADARGQFRTAAFALHTAFRPGQWAAAAKLGSGSKRALAALTERLRELTAQLS